MIKLKTLLEDNNIILEKYVIEYDDYDRYVYSNILKRINNIKKIEQEGLRIYSNFSELLEDIFKSLYKFYPILIPEKMIKFDYLLNYDIVKYFLEDSNFNKLREFTKGSEINSIIGLEYISKDLLNILKQNLETLKEYKQNIDIINSFHGDDNENNNVDKIINQFEYEEAVKIYNEFRENFKKNILKSEKYNINKVLINALNEIVKSLDYIVNWGLESSATYTKTHLENKLDIFNKIKESKKIKEILSLSGYFISEAVTCQKLKMKKGINSYSLIKRGNDLSKILPNELIKLENNYFELLFLKDFSEKNLLQYELTNKNKDEKGPIIVCIDNSGSMEGQGEIYAKATALGILELAKIQNRSVYIIHFDCDTKENLHTNVFLKNTKFNMNEIIDMLEYFTGGGTDFEEPLNLAMEKIETESNFSKADIVFITDGNAPVSEDWVQKFNNWKKIKNIIVHTVLIDLIYNTDLAVSKFSDKIYYFSSIPKNGVHSLPTELYLLL